MSSRRLIDPELVSGLEFLPSIEFSEAILPFVREQMAAAEAAMVVPQDVNVTYEERTIATSAGHEIRVAIHRPRAAAAALPAVLHMHGGGYIGGSSKTMMASNQRMALDAECVVVAVDYRLAPETRHPGPVEDCYEALSWLHRHADALGAEASRIAVAGESAGGGLAAALALMARDRGEVRIVHQHLIYPMIDDRTCMAEPHPYAGEFVWTPASNRFGWSSLLGSEPGRDGISSYAAAAREENLQDLPSTFISVGALDLFVDENIDYARRLMRAGVPTELHIYPGAYHGFDVAAENAQVTKRAYYNSIAALRRALHPA